MAASMIPEMNIRVSNEVKKMLYRERTQLEKVNTTTVESSSNDECNDEFVECLKNALKIMESRQ